MKKVNKYNVKNEVWLPLVLTQHKTLEMPRKNFQIFQVFATIGLK